MEEGKEIILSMKNGKEDLEKCEDESEKKEGTKMYKIRKGKKKR